MYKFYFTLAALLISSVFVYAQVGIGTTTPDASAQLEVVAINKGILIPRITLANRPATPATGLLIYQTDDKPGFYYYNGTAWVNIGPNSLNANLATNGYTVSADGSDLGLKLLPNGAMALSGIRDPVNDPTPSVNFQFNKDGGFVAQSVLGVGTIPATGDGCRVMWHPYRAAFRAGGIGLSSNAWDDTNTGFYSTAFGYNTIARGNWSVAMGYASAATRTYGVAMGYFSNSSGQSAIAIGYKTTASADYSVAIGYRASTNGYSGAMVMGDASTTDSLRAASTNSFSARYAGGYRLFTNATTTTGVTISAGGSSWNTVSDSTKKENFLKPKYEYFLDRLGKLRIGSWNYKVQDKTARHYGPMAQEIFTAFGKDGIGTIGNDSTLATADMDGIMMIMLQGLEKRSSDQLAVNKELTAEMAKVKAEYALLQQQVAKVSGAKKLEETIQTQAAVIEQQSQKISALTAEAEELRKIKQRLDQLEKASVSYTSK